MDKLAVLSEVEKTLASVQTVDEAKSIRDQFEAIRVYVKSSKRGLAIQNRAASIKIQAEQRAGDLLRQIERSKGGGQRTESRLKPVLRESEIPNASAHRWQKMAEVSPGKVRELEAALTEKGEELTSTLIYRHANGGAHVSHNSGETEWYTSSEIIELARSVLGQIDLDPASHPDAQKVIQAKLYFTAKENGLELEWFGRVWLNPPYAQPIIGQFCEKLTREVQVGNVVKAITLTNNATETRLPGIPLKVSDPRRC